MPPSIIKPLKDVTLVCGKPLKLDVVAQGVPQPTVKWYRDENLLEETEFIIETKEKASSLSVKETQSVHTGVYKVVLENSAGILESISNVEIQTKPQFSPPSDISIRAGEEFNVPVLIDGKPSPKVKWLKDKKEIPSSLGLISSENNNIYSLKMKESTTVLNGIYTITATNVAGTETANFRVLVSGKSTII